MVYLFACFLLYSEGFKKEFNQPILSLLSVFDKKCSENVSTNRKVLILTILSLSLEVKKKNNEILGMCVEFDLTFMFSPIKINKLICLLGIIF